MRESSTRVSAFDAYYRLYGNIRGEIVTNENLSKHTSLRVGGPADLYITCEDVSDLTVTTNVLNEERVPWVIFGKGSNILVSDKGYRGAVISLGSGFKKMSVDFDRAEITAGGGAMLAYVTTKAFASNFTGIEFLAGIPGSVGGSISHNAGSKRKSIGDLVQNLVLFHPTEGLTRYNHSDVEWYYRYTTLPTDRIILEATFMFEKSERATIRAKMEGELNRRKREQPLNTFNCGSIFRDTTKIPVSKMIEECGLVGYTVGGATISSKDANFVINKGSATAQDITRVIATMRDKVRDRYGIELKPEVRFLGFNS